MQEEADLGLWQLLTDHSWDQQKMVVVDPDHIAPLPVLNNLIGKGLVDVDIVFPRVVLVRFALGVVGDLVVEHRPEDLLAEVRVVAVKVLIGAKDTQHVVFGGKPVLDVLKLLCALKGISRHAQCADPSVVLQLAVSGGSLRSVSQTAVSLIGVGNSPVGVLKNSVLTLAAFEGARLCYTCTAHRLCLEGKTLR